MVTILIVDDHSIVRQGMRSMLAAAHPDWKFYEAENGVQAILTASKVNPDLILMDHMMPKLDGIKASSVITRELPASRIVMVTMSDLKDVLPGAYEAGVKQVIPKDSADALILETIDKISGEISKTKDQKRVIHQGTKNKIRKSGTRAEKHSSSLLLTDREMEVVKFMMKGYTSKKISGQLGISNRTVEGHLFKIMKKCNLHSTAELIRQILSKKILPGT
ncbi:MAG: response regulator transcription factor [Bacteroidetes bacterium]|nr:response regulator transcription factor [Bacteroidota bacterium]